MAVYPTSGELVTQRSLAGDRIASAAGRRVEQLAHEVDLRALNDGKAAWENGLRAAANVEAGRGAIINRVV